MQLQGGRSDFMNDIKNWWKNCPIINKGIIFISIFVYFLAFVFQFLINFINIPSMIVYSMFHSFRQFIIIIDLIQLLFSLISLVPSSARFEKNQGSVQFYFDFFINNLLIQTFFTMIFIAFELRQFSMIRQFSCGLWPLVIFYITKQCTQNPEQITNFLCFPVQIKQKYYPFLILLFVSLMQIQLDIFVAVIYGYLLSFCSCQNFLQIKYQRLEQLENSCLFKWMINKQGFIKCSSITLQTQIESHIQQSTQQVQALPIKEQETVDPFKGKSVSIGESEQKKESKQVKNQKEYQTLDTEL